MSYLPISQVNAKKMIVLHSFLSVKKTGFLGILDP